MATGMFGADTEQLREVGGDFHRSGELVEGVGFDLRGEIEAVEWIGVDADAYRDEWGDRLRVDFSDLADLLRDYRGRLDRQADDQDDASETGGDEGCLESTWNGVTDAVGGVTSFLGGVVDGIWGDITGMAGLVGFDENWNWSWDNLTSTWTGMGVLIGYNPSDGTWGNWGLAGEAWTMVGKDLIAYDQWSSDGTGAAGVATWNIGSNFLPFGVLGTLGDVGRIAGTADAVADVGRVAGKLDELGDVGRVAGSLDEVGAVGRLADDAGDVGRVADDAADLGRWNMNGTSPDVPVGIGRTLDNGGDAHKLSLHNAPYDTGATIDPVTGDLVSTSGNRFTADQVSHHYTTTTGSANPDLRVSTAPGTTPFEPNHRFVLDDGKTVIETNSLGQPEYTRYTMDGRGTNPETGNFSSDPWRNGTQTSARNWPEDMTHGSVDNRGHMQPAQHRGPNEDLNTPPQSRTSNETQAITEMAISDYYYSSANNEAPLIVERWTEYPSDGLGHAERYRFEVTDSHGNPVTPLDPDGNPAPMHFDD